MTGPLFGFNDTWQLVINTSTTIITFLMVFLIQNTQNRDNDELAFASRAVNTFDEARFARFLELLPHSDVELYSSGYTAQALRRSLDHELMSEPGVVPEVAL